MPIADRVKLGTALVLLCGAGWFVHQFIASRSGPSEKTLFYDLSERKLFAAPRDAVPPIRGINNAEEDAVRAIVISTNGNPTDASSGTIAYLEKYSPVLKAEILKARRNSAPLSLGRIEAQQHRWVKRLSDFEWYRVNSPMGDRIVTEWAHPGPNGISPVVCSP